VTKLFNRRPSAKFSLCLGSLLALAVQPGFLQAETIQTDEWQIEADKVLRFEDPKSVIAEGNVVLTKLVVLPPKQETKAIETSDWSVLLEEDSGEVVVEEVVTQEVTVDTTPRYKTETIIKADWIAYDVEQNSIKAKGNVSISNDTDQLLAEEGVLNLSNETGTFKEATILRKSLDLHLEGETIDKTGVNTYRIQNGWVVTCKVEEENTPPWSFAANETNVTQGEYAVLKHATFRIKDVPVLYTPWLMVPVGNKRQTGLLFPEISNSDQSGFGFNLPLFINLSDSTDLTLYPEYLANRGFMPGMEYRYILGAQKKGTLMGSYLYDELSDPSETEYRQETGYTHTNQDRYWVRGKLDHDFDNSVVTRVDLDIVSDRDYLTEFNSGVTGFDDSNENFLDVYGRGFQNKTSDQRENSFKLLKIWDGMALEGVFLGINDVRQDKTSPTPLWKLPSLDFTGSQPLGESPLTLDWDTDYVNYYREDGVGGHRFDIYPRLSAPLPLGPYLEARSEVGVRDTFYSVQTYGDGTWDEDDTPNRFLGDFHTEIGTTLLRDFALNMGNTTGLTHNFRPFVQYDYLSDTNQDDLPDFDTVDRQEHENAITYGIDNFFTLFGQKNGKDIESDYGYLKIRQSYDLRNEESDTPFSEVNVKLAWNPLRALRILYKTDIDVYGEGVTFYGLESYYSNSRGDYLNLDYRYDKFDDIHQLNVSARAQLLDAIFAAYAIEHSLSESRIIEQNISLMYKPACWSVELKSKYTPGDHTISVLFNLANIGNPLGLRI
jgi:LPS-assembly protein